KFCKAHGGGRRCQNEGCAKLAVQSTAFCIAHGGGRRCQAEAVQWRLQGGHFALRMGAAGAARLRAVPRGLEVDLRSVLRMGGASAARPRVVPRQLKGPPPFVLHMEVEGAVGLGRTSMQAAVRKSGVSMQAVSRKRMCRMAAVVERTR
ncbi:hypothetical protein CYMTET_56682, partial [Cymbomonas tetramitiformis]